MSDRVSIEGEILEIKDPDDIGLINDVMRLLREKAAARQAEEEKVDLSFLLDPITELWVCINIDPEGHHRIMVTPTGMPMLSPNAEITDEIKKMVSTMDPRGGRVELRRYTLAETEDITPEHDHG